MSYEARQLCRFGRRLLLLQEQRQCRAIQQAQRRLQRQLRSSSSAAPYTAAGSHRTDELDPKRLTLPMSSSQRKEMDYASTRGPSLPDNSVYRRVTERQHTLNALRHGRQGRKQAEDADAIDTYERDGFLPEARPFLESELGENWTVS